MNQNSKRDGKANGNSVDEVQRGATRPAAVVAIVLCVGFAVAMVGIWSCGKPPSHQETQTQPEAAVQTETPETEPVSPVSVPDQDESLETSTATPGFQASPAAPSTSKPVSQASPAARQSADDRGNSPASVQPDHVNSPAFAEDDQSYEFSHDLNNETVTFEAVNPTTQVPGLMTVTITGRFRGNRLQDGQSPAGSHLNADHEATFSFVPHDPYSPSYSTTARRYQAAGDTTDDSIHFDFGLTTTGSDGSSQVFPLREVVRITEDDAQVTFSQLK
jgi:hypothetical protein